MKDYTKELQEIAASLGGEEKPCAVPSRKEVVGIVEEVLCLFFPSYFPCESSVVAHSKERALGELFPRVSSEIRAAFAFASLSCEDPDGIALAFLKTLPAVREMLLLDVEALYEGDPAARCKEEVLLSYPGFFAIAVYRIAHEFYRLGVPFLPRMMTEYAHEKTGIDIHAGASIGKRFFIDHGTGTVIGETTTIGDRVKLYQGVTLGAKSFELDQDGNPVKGIKRHPDIGNNVVIYANATVLGGNTKIGDGCTIGANVWLTRSVEPGKTVYYTEK